MEFYKKYTATKEDWISFNKEQIRDTSKTKRVVKGIGLAFSIIMALYNSYNLFVYYSNNKGDIMGKGFINSLKYMGADMALVIAYLVIAAILIYSLFYSLDRHLRKIMNDPNNEALFQERGLGVSEKGILIEDRQSETLKAWDTLEEVVDTKKYLAFVFTNRLTILLPTRDCSDSELETIRTLVKENMVETIEEKEEPEKLERLEKLEENKNESSEDVEENKE